MHVLLLILVFFLLLLILHWAHFIHSISMSFDSLDWLKLVDVIFLFIIGCHEISHLHLLDVLDLLACRVLSLLRSQLHIQILFLEVHFLFGFLCIVELNFVIKKLVEFCSLCPCFFFLFTDHWPTAMGNCCWPVGIQGIFHLHGHVFILSTRPLGLMPLHLFLDWIIPVDSDHRIMYSCLWCVNVLFWSNLQALLVKNCPKLFCTLMRIKGCSQFLRFRRDLNTVVYSLQFIFALFVTCIQRCIAKKSRWRIFNRPTKNISFICEPWPCLSRMNVIDLYSESSFELIFYHRPCWISILHCRLTKHF